MSHTRRGDRGLDAVSDLALERHLLNELPHADGLHVQALLPQHARLRERMRALQASNADIESAYPSAALARDVLDRLARDSAQRPSRVAVIVRWAIPAALAAMLIFAFRPELFVADDPSTVRPGASND